MLAPLSSVHAPDAAAARELAMDGCGGAAACVPPTEAAKQAEAPDAAVAIASSACTEVGDAIQAGGDESACTAPQAQAPCSEEGQTSLPDGGGIGGNREAAAAGDASPGRVAVPPLESGGGGGSEPLCAEPTAADGGGSCDLSLEVPPAVAAAADPAVEDLRACLRELGEAEARWGPDNVHVACVLRRIATSLERRGRVRQALPLWIRILEIEGPALGGEHPDVVAAAERVRAQLERPEMRAEEAEAFADVTPVAAAANLVPKVPGPAHAGGKDADSGIPATLLTASSNLVAGAAAVSGTIVHGVGTAFVSGALSLGTAAATSTASLAAGAAGHVAYYAAEQAAGAALGSAPAAAAAAVEPAGWASTAVGLAGSAALGTARAASSVALGTVQHVGVAVTSTAVTSVLGFAGRQAVSGAATVAEGAFDMVWSARWPGEEDPAAMKPPPPAPQLPERELQPPKLAASSGEPTAASPRYDVVAANAATATAGTVADDGDGGCGRAPAPAPALSA